jgi:hypothetical protein
MVCLGRAVLGLDPCSLLSLGKAFAPADELDQIAVAEGTGELQVGRYAKRPLVTACECLVRNARI